MSSPAVHALLQYPPSVQGWLMHSWLPQSEAVVHGSPTVAPQPLSKATTGIVSPIIRRKVVPHGKRNSRVFDPFLAVRHFYGAPERAPPAAAERLKRLAAVAYPSKTSRGAFLTLLPKARIFAVGGKQWE